MGRSLELYRNRRVALQLPLGYASGLPLLLTADTLGIWMATEGINLKTIGAFSLVGLAYNAKVLWAPLLDRYPLPLLGRRRGWLLLFQILLMFAMGALGSAHPSAAPLRTAALATLVAFLSASQDIVVDAYKADVLHAEERAAGVGVFSLGYRIGMLAAGMITLVMVHKVGWPAMYRALGISMIIGVAATLFAPEPERIVSRPRTVLDAYVHPLQDLVRRRGWYLIVAFVLLYRFGFAIAKPMGGPFLIQLGFTTTDLGYWQKGVGLPATLIGGLLAGPAVARLGTFRAMLIFGFTQALVHLAWAAMVFTGPRPWMLAISIGVENLFIGLTVTAFDAYLIALCNSSYSASQFALFTSMASLAGRLFGSTSGALAVKLGWPMFFVATSVLVLPSLLLLAFLPRKPGTVEPESAEQEPPS